MFHDRKDAGRKLAKQFEGYQQKNPVVLGIARGGVEIAYEIAKYLDAEFDALITRKLPMPGNPEAGFGAVAEDGSIYMQPRYEDIIPSDMVEKIKKQQIKEIKRRIEKIRAGRQLPEIENRIVIIADDGIAMGSTMRASIQLCRRKNCSEVVVAAPVSGIQTKQQIQDIADETVILETPSNFRAVAEVYENWYDVPDEEAVEILQQINHV